MPKVPISEADDNPSKNFTITDSITNWLTVMHDLFHRWRRITECVLIWATWLVATRRAGSAKCLPFTSNWDHHRILNEFMSLPLWFSMLWFVDWCLSFNLFVCLLSWLWCTKLVIYFLRLASYWRIPHILFY